MDTELNLEQLPKVKLTAANMRDRIRARYAGDQWAVMFEVRNTAGFAADRSADAIAMNMWPSKGLALHGFEIKVSRSDWLRELKQPRKAEAFEHFCDYWWIVAPRGVVNVNELPTNWGLYEDYGDSLKVVVKATQNGKPEPLSRGFIAAMFRRVTQADEGEVERRVAEGVAEAKEQREARFEAEVKRRTRDVDTLREKIATIERVSGININGWTNNEAIGRAVGLVHRLGITETHTMIRNAKDAAERFAQQIDEALPPASDNG